MNITSHNIFKGGTSCSLYDDMGYLNYHKIINKYYPFTVIYGGRGIGKTYGILKHCIQHHIPFIYMRRSQVMLEMLGTDALNPTKVVFNDMDTPCRTKKQGKYIVRFLYEDDEGEEAEAGIMVALSTFSNLRGFDASQYSVLIFDEFIPQVGDHKIAYEGVNFLNAIETIGRNREIQGKEPILTFMLTNANTLNSDVLLSLNLFDTVLKMQTSGLEWVKDKSRGLQVIRPESKISELKAETSLYKFAGEGDFSEMAIGNTFKKPDVKIKSYDLKGWKTDAYLPQEEITIYKKGKRYYVTDHFSGEPKHTFIMDKKGTAYFHREMLDFIYAIVEKRAAFQNLKLYYQLSNLVKLE